MTFDELKIGMKSLFSSLGAKTSDSNYGVALLDKTSGEPKGLMGMSDLASVLGVSNRLKIINIGNGATAFKTSIAHGFIVALQSDFKRCGVYFAMTTGLGSGNVIFHVNEKIVGDLTPSTNNQGTWTINNADSGMTVTVYYIPIE